MLDKKLSCGISNYVESLYFNRFCKYKVYFMLLVEIVYSVQKNEYQNPPNNHNFN